jgi:hypothetical protein
MSNMHIRSWCRPKDISFNDHPQCMATKQEHDVLITINYKAPVTKGSSIMQKVKTSINPLEGTLRSCG